MIGADERGFATGGVVSGEQATVARENDYCHHCCHRPDATPRTITINVHGNPPNTDKVVRRILAELRTSRTYGRNPLAKDQA